ncbi:MAG TPA: cytochrome c biogenesis protein CcdA, partial [Roseiflexaceae bacterium]|nr:cytochrome c biogenesis protein CcdA [Roseiflexaceae bacterium]
MTTSDVQPVAAPARRLFLIVGGFVLLAIVLTILSVGVGANAAGLPGGGSMLILAPAAFLAGVLSFLSPCTLPILPAYFAWTFQSQRERVVTSTVAFFLGLATTMVLLGASATALSKVLFRNLDTITLVGGFVIIVFGVLSLLGKGFEGMKILQRPTASLAGSYVYGATFALGWTSCVGPILGALLTMLATQGFAVLQGAVLAFIYALGLGTPLIVVAGLFSRLGSGSRFWGWMKGRGVEVNLGFTTLYLHTT